MSNIMDLCFLCTKDYYTCSPVNKKIVSQVEYLLPEITIFKLGVPLRICTICDGVLNGFSKFKQSCVENSRRLEASIKGAQSRSLHTGSPPVVDDNETTDVKPEKIEEITIKEEFLELPVDSTINPDTLLETISAEPQNQLHKDRVSQNMQLYTDTNNDKIEEIFIKEEQMEETPQDREVSDNIVKEECLNNSMIDNTDSQPEHNTEDETNEEVLEGSSADSKIETLNEIKSQEHVKKNHGRIKNLPCTVCKKVFKYKYNLIKHMNLHNIKYVSCSICKKRYRSKNNLRQHMRFHTERKGKDFQCQICNKSFTRKNYFNKHMEYHSGLKNYECETCGKSFTLRAHLQRHLVVHSKVKDFKCKLCEKTFKLKIYLTSHMRTHTEQKDFQCEKCGKKFVDMKDINRHMRLHSEVKDFQCHICQKSFVWKSVLQQHLKLHTGVKDIQCEVCGKAFGAAQNLRSHMKMHSEVKELRCDICEKPCTWRSELSKHIKTHSTIYKCTVCEERFVQKRDFSFHITIHNHIQTKSF